MGFLASTFTWWNGATLGTKFGLRGKTRMGEDALGNVYYEGGKDTAGNPRRWVIYQGATDASRVPPAWFSWLHHQVADVPDRALPPVPDGCRRKGEGRCPLHLFVGGRGQLG